MTLDEYRKQNDLSVAQLAERIGIAGAHKVKTVSRYLRRERTPSIEVIGKISEATGGDVTFADFLASTAQPSEAQP